MRHKLRVNTIERDLDDAIDKCIMETMQRPAKLIISNKNIIKLQHKAMKMGWFPNPFDDTVEFHGVKIEAVSGVEDDWVYIEEDFNF